MAQHHFRKSSRLEHPADRVFAWHERPGAFRRLMPPWERVAIREMSRGLGNGARTVFTLRVGPLPVTWVAEHKDYVEGRQFVDVQTSGPFAFYEHTHRMDPAGEGACVLDDAITYRLPLGPLGALCGGPMVRRRLEQTFGYRHAVTSGDLDAHAASPLRPGTRFLITGSTGLVGGALDAFLMTGGHSVTRLHRAGTAAAAAPARRSYESRVVWDPARGFDAATLAALEGHDVVIHLAGENIAAGRWTAARKKRIRDSRVLGTAALAAALAELRQPPRALISASAIGAYGSRGDEELDEASARGSDFLATTCREWEEATAPAEKAGIRTVHARFGVILTPAGGALKKMLLPFLAGVGGRVGPGTQWMSWIALDDVIYALHHLAGADDIAGPVNVVAPRPVTNAEFTKVLGRVLRRPTVAPLPAFQVKLLFGELGEALLLGSQRVQPARLEESGHEFRYPDLESALRHVLGRRLV